MISSLLKKVFGSRNDRLVKQYRQTVARINALESGLTGLSDEALGAKTAEFRQRLANGETLEQLLPAFAVCREASRRAMGMRHFDVQLIGGMVLQRRQDCRNAHRRRQNAGGHPAGLPECADRQRRAHRHRQRLPGQPRCGADGALYGSWA